MATRSKKPTAEEMAPAKPAITSLVKKDLKQVREYAAAINKAMKEPSIVAMRICECCVQVS
jgi:hypothetical protein